ncbi:MAG: hypothetical protein MUE73_07665 [Planctomycetes bacterium]|nr:hypothetical protein [Planctomycetota bacterium]
MPARIGEFLRGEGRFAPDAPAAGRMPLMLGFLFAGGLLYGAVMGAWGGLTPDRWPQLLYSGLKVPLLLGATFLLCLPSYYVVNLVAGLGDDFGQALRAVVATQSCVTVVLAALAPVTVFFYLCLPDYRSAVTFNGAMFAVGCLAATRVVRRYYGPLIRKHPRHRAMLRFWFLFYVFVGIQMGWVLRPFIGTPNAPVRFFREGAWGNAYEVVLNLLTHSIDRVAR